MVYSAPWCEVLRNLSSVFQQLILDAGYLNATPFLQANVRILQSDYLHLKEKQIIKQTSKSPRRLVLGGEVRREELMPRYSTRKQGRGLIPRPPLAGSPGVDKSRRPGIPVALINTRMDSNVGEEGVYLLNVHTTAQHWRKSGQVLKGEPGSKN